MASSFVFYPGDGVQTDWSVPFPYLDKAHVTVLVDGSTTSFTWVTDSTVRVSPAVASGHTILVQRTTPDAPLATFSNTNNLTADNLTLAETQALYVAQEARDKAASASDTATAAKTEADTAKTEADSAAATASAAQTTATNAQTTATNAQTAAEAAQSSASAAQAAAEAASAAATVHVAADLPYNNSTSHLAAADVQAAIDLIAGAAGITAIAASSITNDSTVTGAKVKDALETLKAALAALATVATSGAYSDLTGRPALATVATSGAYGDLTGKPTLGALAAKNTAAYGDVDATAIASASEFIANTASKLLSAAGAWSAANPVDLGSQAAGTITLDCNTALNFKWTQAGNQTIAVPTGIKNGQVGTLTITQDATGGRTLSFNASWKPIGGTMPLWNAVAGSVNYISFINVPGVGILFTGGKI